jgi:mono/diheme cytochrome c family protein
VVHVSAKGCSVCHGVGGGEGDESKGEKAAATA